MINLRSTQGLMEARATFQSLADSKVVHGWIIDVAGPMLTVRAPEDPPLDIPSRFVARTARLNGDLAFLAELVHTVQIVATDALKFTNSEGRATLLDFGDRTHVFQILGQMIPLPASGDPRFVCEPIEIRVGGKPATLRDVSPAGFGVHTPHEFRQGELVEAYIDTGKVALELLAEARYSRRLASLPPTFRVGFQLMLRDRIEKARWMNMVRDRSIQSTRLPEGRDLTPAVEPVAIPTRIETGVRWATSKKIAEFHGIEETEEERNAPPPPEPDEVELWTGRDADWTWIPR